MGGIVLMAGTFKSLFLLPAKLSMPSVTSA